MEIRGPARACLELCRAGNLPTVWTNVLAAAVLAQGLTPRALATAAPALSCFYAAGMALNDLCDADVDRGAKPGRPIPSGRISRGRARVVVVVLAALGFLLLAAAPSLRGIPAAAVLLAAIVAYDLRHKDQPFSVLLMALCRFLVFVVTALAAVGNVPVGVLVAGGAQFGYSLSVSLVARRENERLRHAARSLVPPLLAGICIVDGLVLAFLADPAWLAAGIAGALLTAAGQRLARGD